MLPYFYSIISSITIVFHPLFSLIMKGNSKLRTLDNYANNLESSNIGPLSTTLKGMDKVRTQIKHY